MKLKLPIRTTTKRLWIFCLVFFLIQFNEASAQVVVESTSQTSSDDVDNITLSHTINSSSDRLLLVGISYRRRNSDVTVTNVTYGGVAMSEVGTQTVDNNGNEGRIYISDSVWWMRDRQEAFQHDIPLPRKKRQPW